MNDERQLVINSIFDSNNSFYLVVEVVSRHIRQDSLLNVLSDLKQELKKMLEILPMDVLNSIEKDIQAEKEWINQSMQSALEEIISMGKN